MQAIVKVLVDAEIEAVAHRAFASRCRIYDLDAQIKAAEATIPPNQRANSPELAKLHQELNQVRAEWAASETKLEALKARHSGAIALANLLAAYVQAGKDTAGLEAEIEAALNGKAVQEQKPAAGNAQVAQPAQAQPAQNQARQVQTAQNNTATGTFRVLEVRESRPGVIRAYAEAGSGEKFPIFAKNGNAQTLAGAVGKQVQVKYRQGEKGLIALSVRLAG